MRELHLDAEYRRRWEEYHLADGQMADSRLVNWRSVEWEKVVKITVNMDGRQYSVDCSDPRFRFFMNFRWGGQEPTWKNGVYIGHKPIHIWTIGWSDGSKCFLKDIDFFTGALLKEYIRPLSEFKAHVHPRVGKLATIK